jgi:hypothetical protein
MSKNPKPGEFKIDTGSGTYRITQNIRDISEGLRRGDLSRISAYGGADRGVHTGSNSDTLGRHGQPFKKS